MDPIFDREVETWNSLYSSKGLSRKYALFQGHARRRTELRMALCLKLLAPKDGMTVLDVGCGSGMFRKPIEASRAHWMGIDVSFNMLAHGKGLADHEEGRAGWVNGSGEALPFSSDTFEAIVCIGVVNFHRPAVVSEFLKEISRVLKPGGALILTSLRLDVLTWIRSRLYPWVPLPFSSPGPLYPMHFRQIFRLAEGLPFACEEMEKVSKYLGLPHYTIFRFRKKYEL